MSAWRVWWEPLDSEAGPREYFRVHLVVKEWYSFLPYIFCFAIGISHIAYFDLFFNVANHFMY